jgi:hypothetical protein
MANLGPVVVIPEPLMKYRYHNNSISAKKFYLQRMLIFYPVARNRARLDNRELTLEEYIIDYYDKPLVTLILRRIGLTGRYYYRHAGVLLSEGKRIQAAIALMVAIILNPISITKRIRGRLLG